MCGDSRPGDSEDSQARNLLSRSGAGDLESPSASTIRQSASSTPSRTRLSMGLVFLARLKCDRSPDHMKENLLWIIYLKAADVSPASDLVVILSGDWCVTPPHIANTAQCDVAELRLSLVSPLLLHRTAGRFPICIRLICSDPVSIHVCLGQMSGVTERGRRRQRYHHGCGVTWDCR